MAISPAFFDFASWPNASPFTASTVDPLPMLMPCWPNAFALYPIAIALSWCRSDFLVCLSSEYSTPTVAPVPIAMEFSE